MVDVAAVGGLVAGGEHAGGVAFGDLAAERGGGPVSGLSVLVEAVAAGRGSGLGEFVVQVLDGFADRGGEPVQGAGGAGLAVNVGEAALHRLGDLLS